ncbi:hypothetical protein C5O23_14095, partial [Duncaniella muris]
LLLSALGGGLGRPRRLGIPSPEGERRMTNAHLKVLHFDLESSLEARLNIGAFSKKGESYYGSIIDLVHRYNRSISDAELASTVLAECCDLELSKQYIPDTIWRLMLRDSGVSANRKIEDLTNDEIVKLNISLGKILYATRNSIVHAKSNYTPTGKECLNKDIGALNEFMKVFCYAIIMHNNNID